ncbi:NAD(P)/FAD-dependent oxidoreductase [Peristeroidobacter soli]|uniref:NAD(P)/FAD-dependent oxidoreductase n=1 Tax=Peristeroidobacter soli TaxID=2497877 RepID=UPI00101BB28C|nr:FAD-dependent oxidoreductase [Peristeroidobacter soli]
MQADITIIGGGMAGAAAAYFLSRGAAVVLLEREEAAGLHSSGRSSEQFTVGISADTMRRLAQASRPFLENPPGGFAPLPLLASRGCLTVGRADQQASLQRLYGRLTGVGAEARYVDRNEALQLFPALRAEKFDSGVLEPGAMDIDVNTLLQAYLRGARANGAKILTNAGANAIERKSGKWIVTTPVGEVVSSMVLNAAGAWVDDITRLAGLAPIGLTPHRRTAFTFLPTGIDASRWPHVSNVDYRWYVSPRGDSLVGSLADAVPVPPGDVYPDDMDVAQGIENIEQDTTFKIDRPLSKWAGLRNFVADKNPVCGTRVEAEGFFWLAGQGGCGILTSPALGQAVAALMSGRELPEEQRTLGLTAEALSPSRKELQS